MGYTHVKRYQNFFGLDRKSNDLQFPEKYATDCLNIQAMKNSTLEKRRGFQAVGGEGAKFGTFLYTRFDPTTGAETSEVLGATSTINKRNEVILTVNYATGNPTCFLSIFYDTETNVYRCQIFEGAAFVLDTSLNVGFDEASPKTINQLAAEINALTGFSAAVTGVGTTPAAFLEMTIQQDLSDSSLDLKAYYWTALTSPVSNMLSGSETNKNSVDFENVSSVQLQNCIYFANGYDEILKYDGNKLYRAGVPEPTTVSASGTVGAREYTYRVQYVQVDAAGNTIEGNVVDAAMITVNEPSVNPVTVTFSTISSATGYNTGCAIISGSGAGTTIPVNAGHTIASNDTIYLWDTVTSAFVTRTVQTVAATTITVTSSIGYSAVAGQNVMSANLKVRILRNRNTAPIPATLWYVVAEIPHNSLAGATQSYTDNKADSAISFEFEEPATDRSPPIKGRYISQFQNLMVTAGNIQFPNVVSFSDVENAEYFPLPDNQYTIQTRQGDKITGIAPSAENFIVFHSRSIHAMTGDVPNQNVRVDLVTQDIGCAAHASISQVRGALMFLSEAGPRMMIGAQIPSAIGMADEVRIASRIDPDFEQRTIPESSRFYLKRAVGFHDQLGEKFLLFVPVMNQNGADRYCTDQSRVYAYDYTRDAWWLWSEINFASGIVAYDKDVFFTEQTYSDTFGQPRYIFYRFNNTGTPYDYQDNINPISCTWSSPWEFLGEAGILKTLNSIRVYSSESVGSAFSLGVEIETNFSPGYIVSSCTIQNPVSGYGLDGYGLLPYGDLADSAPKHKLSVGRIRSARINFYNHVPQTNIALTGFELEFSTPYDAAFKK